VLQYMFRVSDRAAVDNTIMRRDWRIALGITPEYTGFAPRVLYGEREVRGKETLAQMLDENFSFFERRVHEHYQQLMRDRQRGHINSRAKPPPKQRRQLAPAGPRPSAPGRLGKLPRRQ